MSKSFYIESTILIQNGRIYLNEEEVFSNEAENFSTFSKSAYQHFELVYPRFFKMDNLSKLAFLGADILLKRTDLNEEENDIALVFANRSSSLDSDSKYQESISDKNAYFPSPAVFVYTLPNICLGEISIKHKLHSENCFFVFETFDPKFLLEYSDYLLLGGKAEKVLWGWVEYLQEEYKAFLCLVSQEGTETHHFETINKKTHP